MALHPVRFWLTAGYCIVLCYVTIAIILLFLYYMYVSILYSNYVLSYIATVIALCTKNNDSSQFSKASKLFLEAIITY